MKKKFYFILLIMSSLLAACKKEPKEEVVGYRFTYTNTIPNTLSQEFLFLLDEKNNVLKEKEVGSSASNELTAVKNAENYSIGHFKEGAVYQNKKCFYYDLVRNVPNGKNWKFNTLGPLFLHKFTTFETDLLVKNLPNLDSFYLIESKISNSHKPPVFDASKKELSYNCLLGYMNYSYIYIREHKDSSFRYSLLKMPKGDIGEAQKIQLDFNNMKKAIIVEFQPKEEFRIINIYALIEGGLFNLFYNNWYNDINVIHLVLPEEIINTYYVESRYGKEKNSLTFFDKVSDLSKISLGNLPLLKESVQSNGNKKLELASGKPILVEHYFTKSNKNSHLSLKEILPYNNEKEFVRVAPKVPQTILNTFKDLEILDDGQHLISLYHLKNASLDYATFLEKHLNYNHKYYQFDTWIYDVGYCINNYVE